MILETTILMLENFRLSKLPKFPKNGIKNGQNNPFGESEFALCKLISHKNVSISNVGFG